MTYPLSVVLHEYSWLASGSYRIEYLRYVDEETEVQYNLTITTTETGSLGTRPAGATAHYATEIDRTSFASVHTSSTLRVADGFHIATHPHRLTENDTKTHVSGGRW